MGSSFELLLARIRTPEKNLPHWGWRFAVGMIAIYLVALLITLIASASAADAPLDNLEPGVIAWANLMGCLLTLFLLIQYAVTSLDRAREAGKTQLTIWEALRLTPSINTPLWIGLFITFALAIAINTIGLILGVPLDTLPAPLHGLSPDQTQSFISGIIVVVVLRPIVEEILFRSLLYTSLIKHFSQLQAIAISSSAFALLHFALDPEFLWWGFVEPLALGIVAGCARAATQSTQSAIGAHVMFGLFIMLRAVLY